MTRWHRAEAEALGAPGSRSGPDGDPDRRVQAGDRGGWQDGRHDRGAASEARRADRRARAAARARRLRLGPRADPRVARAVPGRGDLRTRRRDREPATTRNSSRSSATCSTRWSSTPTSPPSRARLHPRGRRGPHDREDGRPAPARVRRRSSRRPPDAVDGELGRAQGGREAAPRQRARRHPAGDARARARRQAARSGRRRSASPIRRLAAGGCAPRAGCASEAELGVELLAIVAARAADSTPSAPCATRSAGCRTTIREAETWRRRDRAIGTVDP